MLFEYMMWLLLVIASIVSVMDKRNNDVCLEQLSIENLELYNNISNRSNTNNLNKKIHKQIT